MLNKLKIRFVILGITLFLLSCSSFASGSVDKDVLIGFIEDVRGTSEEIIESMVLELTNVQVKQKQMGAKGREKLILIYDSLNLIKEVYARFEDGIYTDQEAKKLDNATTTISLCFSQVSEENLWEQRSDPTVSVAFTSLSEVWRIGESAQIEIINAINLLP